MNAPRPLSDAIRFAPLNDGSEEDCQCARCGSSVTMLYCERCGGDGEIGDDGWEDEGGWIDSGYPYNCPDCGGEGSWYECLSPLDWCESHPIPGRESIERGKVEWFTIERGSGPSDPSQTEGRQTEGERASVAPLQEHPEP